MRLSRRFTLAASLAATALAPLPRVNILGVRRFDQSVPFMYRMTMRGTITFAAKKNLGLFGRVTLPSLQARQNIGLFSRTSLPTLQALVFINTNASATLSLSTLSAVGSMSNP